MCDVLIAGSGIAGLTLALKLNKQCPDRKIYVLSKGNPFVSNTRHAQGGMSVVCDTSDSFEQHIGDTLKAGDGLCKKDVVEKVIRYGKTALAELMENGVDLDRHENGDLVLGREGGHSRSRIVHYKDMTGFQIAAALLVKVNATRGITLLPHHAVIDLITDRDVTNSFADTTACCGAFVLDERNRRVEKFISRVTVLATGGIGQVYKTSTNPKIATGDGIGIAHRAGASIENMEFIQFHPTSFFSYEPCSPNFLISEAIRGYGAFLRNCYGERFMFNYDPQGELAGRDVVARAIEREIKSTGCPCVFVDCTHLPPEALMRGFPKIHAHCQENGIRITTDLIPVTPAAHYLCGGITVDTAARTSIPNLYALGECANTGLHGANRLASNSLLEAVAFAEFCFQNIRESIGSAALNTAAFKTSRSFCVEAKPGPGLEVLRSKVQNLMTRHAGITRTTKGLQYALGYLELVEKRLDAHYPDAVSIELLELRNILITAKLIVIQSLNRKTNRGSFFNSDLDANHAVQSDKQSIHF